MWLLPEGRSIVSPLSFKNTIGKFAPRFTGYSYVKIVRKLNQIFLILVNKIHKNF
jgi:hypothetical protein